ncbi:hypothetical protein EJ04DRAFT_132631 [Polyplosphaeria fusca]|uniref:Uncharacterized protein n=1 Tax=Polyplosphaeria fusca TaxID=682080 RepID=A0A9P4UTB8_9PLEO|nr:hypothetical protein EJ04DRAFT_132631 [Polyplosphaeria fusca]
MNPQSLVILVISKLPKARRGRAWKVFWYAYYILTDHMDAFVVDYCEAWSQQPSFDAEIVLFVENGHRIAIPCSSTADDKDLVRHLRTFYDLILANGGLSEFLGLKSSTRIDIVEIEQEFAVGNRAGPPLDLGRYGPYNRQIHYFRDPSQLTGTKIRDRLLKESVLGHRGTQQRGINIVRTWNPRAASTTVLIPVMISFCISVVWSIVASVHFKADVQSSTQTGFTIGSYVVTAGTV